MVLVATQGCFRSAADNHQARGKGTRRLASSGVGRVACCGNYRATAVGDAPGQIERRAVRMYHYTRWYTYPRWSHAAKLPAPLSLCCHAPFGTRGAIKRYYKRFVWCRGPYNTEALG